MHKLKRHIPFSLLLLFWITFAQEGALLPEETPTICEDVFTINGPEIVYVGEGLNYSVSSVLNQEFNFPFSYTLTLDTGERQSPTSKDAPLSFSLDMEGTYILTAKITKDQCHYQIEKTVKSYQESLVYIGENEDAFQLNFDQNFAEQGKHFFKIIVGNNTPEEEIKTLLRKEFRNLSHASIILIKNANFDQILTTYIELLDQELVTSTKRELFIVSNTNQSFLNRVLSVFIPHLGNQQIFTVKTSNFLNLLTALSLQKGEEEISSLVSLHILQETGRGRYLFLSYFIDEAITHGVPLQVLGTLLVVTFLVLIISSLRQVVGLSVFGVYQPLLFAVTLFLVGWKSTLFFFLIAILATVLLRLFSKQVSLLQSSKISLLVCLYAIFLIIGLFATYYRNIEIWTKLLRSNSAIILPIVVCIMVSDKLFTEHFKLWEKSAWFSLIEFSFLALLSWGLLEWHFLRTFMLSYPEVLFGILIAIIVVGRFTGLQVLELIRFMPLIRKRFEDEEE